MMVKLADLRRRGRRNPDFRKCTAIAAVVSALLMMGIELAGGGPVGQAKAGIGDVVKTGAAEDAGATAPGATARE